MRAALLTALLLLCSTVLAEERPLRFSVSDSWAMPMARIEYGKVTGGILYDLYHRLAEKAGRRAELMVMPGRRIQQAVERGDIDVRCYVHPDWIRESHYRYAWSLPFMIQHDLLVAREPAKGPMTLATVPAGERIGSVLGFVYPTLEPYFQSGQLIRDDARTQEQTLLMLEAGRLNYANSNALSLNWFNRTRTPARQLHAVTEVAAVPISCIVKDEPDVPTMTLLRAMVRMKYDGEFDAILARYQ